MVDANYAEGNKQLSGGIETTYGTIAADLTGWIGVIQDFKGPVKKTTVPIQGWGFNRQTNNVAVVAKDVTGSIDWLPQNAAMLKFLGKLQTSGVGPYTHDITPDTNPGSFSLVGTSVDPLGGSNHVTRQYVGCMLSSLQIAYPKKDHLKMTGNFIAQDATKTTSRQTLTPMTSPPYMVPITVLKVDGVEDANVYNAVVNIDCGLSTDDHVFNSLNIVRPAPGQYGQTITFDRNFVNSDLFDKILAGTEVDIELLTTRGANDTFKVTLTDCQFSDHDKSSGFKEKQKENVTLTAENWAIEVIDSISAYGNL